MKVKRRILNEVKGQPTLQKALALAILLKSRTQRDSTIKDYTINKIHVLASVSAATIKKYLPVMEDMGLVRYTGKNGQHLLIEKVSSKADSRNCDIPVSEKDTMRDVYQSLRAFLALLIQYRKDYVRRTLLAFSNPQRGDDFKSLRQQVKGLVYAGVLCGIFEKYKELGISYKRIAKETGNCQRTAERIIKYAIAKNWVKKTVNIISCFVKGVCHRFVYGFDCTTRNNAYIFKANTYDLKPCFISMVELGGKK